MRMRKMRMRIGTSEARLWMMAPLIVLMGIAGCGKSDERADPTLADAAKSAKHAHTNDVSRNTTIAARNTTSADGVWELQPPMRNARAAHAVVSTGKAIYALAGTGQARRPVLEVERFDGKEWTVETVLPGSGLNAPAAVFLDGSIYVIGGFNTTTNVPTDKVL